MTDKMITIPLQTSGEVQEKLRVELKIYESYLPVRYSSIVHKRLNNEYSRMAIRQTKAGHTSITTVLIELVLLAKEEYAKANKALNS